MDIRYLGPHESVEIPALRLVAHEGVTLTDVPLGIAIALIAQGHFQEVIRAKVNLTRKESE